MTLTCLASVPNARVIEYDAMKDFKRMCDSGMFTKGVYASQPRVQQQCYATFPK